MKIKIDYRQGEKKVLSVVTMGTRMSTTGKLTFCFNYLGFDNTFFEITLKGDVINKLTLIEDQFPTDKVLETMLHKQFDKMNILEDKRKN